MTEEVSERAVSGMPVSKWPGPESFRTPLHVGLALLLFLTQAGAERRVGAAIPVLRPTAITVLREASDIPGPVNLSLDNVALSPNGRLFTYTTYNDLRIWNMLTQEEAIIVTGPVHVAEWGSKGDALAGCGKTVSF